MTQKTTAYLVLALLIGVGFLAGSFMGGFLAASLTVPAKHKAIVDDMKLTLVANGLELQVKFVDSHNAEWGKGCPLSMFDVGTTYTSTTWLWQRYGDTEFVMQIWGPGNDGKTYQISLGRVSGGNAHVLTYKGVTKLTIAEITDWTSPMVGYYWFDLEVA
jgi:hypothetical protein